MIYSKYIFLILFCTINSILPVHARNLPFHNSISQFETIRSALGPAYDVVERFQCPNELERFGGSCYFFPNTKSMPNLTSQTCSRYSNNSQLMKIRHLSELSYAAHLLKVHNQPGLILEIDPKLLKETNNFEVLPTKDWVKWQETDENFRQARDSFYRRKMKTSDQFPYGDKPVSNDLTAMEIGNYKDFEQLSKLTHACDKIQWNADKNDSHIFLLTTYLDLTKTVCSLSDIEPNEPSEFICQYVLDYCFNNGECGKFGRCINTLTCPKCLCYLSFFQGPNCRSISSSGIQMIIAVIIIIVIQLYLRREGLKTLGTRIKHVLTCCKKDEDSTKNGENSVSVTDDDSDEHTHFSLWLFGIGISILLLLVTISIVYRPSLLRFNPIEGLDIDVLANDSKQVEAQCKRYRISQGITMLSGVFVFFIVSVSLLINQRKRFDGFCNVLTQFLIPFKPFELVNRYETAAVFGVVVFEILTIFINILFDSTEIVGPGVLTKPIQRLWNLFLIIIKYYPIFITLRQSNIIINFLAVIYYIVILVFIIWEKISCWNFFSPLGKVSDIAEAKFYIMHGKWILGFGLFQNILYFISLAYIGTEVIARFFDVLERVRSKETGVFTIILSNKMCGITKRKYCCSFLGSVFNYFYPWDDKFQFVTISLCTYIGAFISVHYLTCSLTLYALMGRSIYMNFLIDGVEWILDVKIREFLLRREIILSGAITMFFFCYQLLTGMKNCKENAEIPSKNKSENGSSTNWITSESIKYLSFCCLCMFGCVYIIFAGGLFTSIVFTRILTQFATVDPFLSFILPSLILYLLEKSVMSIIGTFLANRSNTVVNILYGLYIIFIFISSFRIAVAVRVFRLLKYSLANIISGTQIDCSKLGQPAEVPRCLCIEHETNNDTTRNSKDEDAEEDTQSLAPDQPCDSAKASSIYDDHQHEELIHDISLSIPLSPDVKPQENRPFFQPRRSADTTTSSKQNPTTNPSNSSRNRREKHDDDRNSQQQQSLILQDFKLSLEDDSEDRQYSFRRTTAV